MFSVIKKEVYLKYMLVSVFRYNKVYFPKCTFTYQIIFVILLVWVMYNINFKYISDKYAKSKLK